MMKIEEAGFVFQRKEYFTSVYQVEKFLGQGAFAKVFLCSHIISADNYAVKIMEKRVLKSD
jgi:serine/threonine protein kinase